MSPIDLFFTHARSAWLIMMGPSDFRVIIAQRAA